MPFSYVSGGKSTDHYAKYAENTQKIRSEKRYKSMIFMVKIEKYAKYAKYAFLQYIFPLKNTIFKKVSSCVFCVLCVFRG